jgi:hypothetical protein
LESDEFWELSPAEFQALRRIHESVRDEHRSMYAALQAAIHNAWLRGKGRRAFKPSDFLPSTNGSSVRDKQMLFRQVIEFQTRELPKAELPPQESA